MADKPEVEKKDFEDRHDDVAAAFDAVAAPEPTDVAPPVAAKPAVEPEPETLQTDDAPLVPETKAEKIVEGAAPAPVEPEKIEPPSNWPKADQERFKEWPEAAQKQVLDRIKAQEADYTRKTMEIADFKKEYGAVDEMFAPFKAQLRAAGYTPATAIQSWMAAEQALNNPATREQAILAIAKNYQIDIAKLAGVPEAAKPAAGRMPTAEELAAMPEQEQIAAILNPYLAKAIAPYETQIAELKAGLERAQQFQNGALNGQRQQVLSNVVQEVQTFANAKDATGNLLHPYFKDVEEGMSLMLAGYQARGLPAPSLEEIYQRAVRADPSTHERVTAQLATAAETKRAQEARAKAAQAKRAGSSVSGAPGSGQPRLNGAEEPVSIRDSIMAAMEASA